MNLNKSIKRTFPKWLKQEVVEQQYIAKFVGVFALPTGTTGTKFTEEAWPIFYCAEPDLIKEHKHYFALVVQEGSLLITDGSYIEGKLIPAIRADDGEVIYSASVHSFIQSEDASVWIDGGYDYTRHGGMGLPRNPFLITVKDGVFVYPTEAANEDTIKEVEETFVFTSNKIKGE